ncbi:Nhlrc2 [Symbiodinium natans]|uniref:Nhlrc2 protein n=1 Tax=Symbiodinium natans TaxID=878477 RepID=A0A812JF54_9DINO|nr:Nhlrc2 [Symbiodinium natans]
MRRPGNRRARLLKTLFQCTFVFSLGLSIDTLSDRPSSIWALLALCAAEEQIEQRPACDLHSCTSKLPFQAGERVALRQLATRLAPNLALGQPVVLSSTAQYVSEDGTETWTGDGNKATDGDFGTAFFFGMGCAETKVTPDPWLRVDLGREVPVAVVRIMTRSDSVDTGLGPLDIRLGNAILTWRENLVCAEAVVLDRLKQPNAFNCLASGRYLWIVLRVSGTLVAPLSVCEVEVTPKGPSGNRHVLQTAGGMWPLQLTGVALAPHDRIRIVADAVLCGLEGSATMHDDVLALTAPMGQRAHGDFASETWENIQINRMGIYKVCWCGGDGDCSLDEHFAMHVATLIINGIMLTVAGDGRIPNRTIDMVDGAPGVQSPLSDPYGIAVSNQRVFFTERGTHMLRWLDIEQGRIYTLAGQFFPGTRGDYGSAFNAQLSTPLGLALDKDHTFLYIADYGSDRVRRIELTRNPLNRGIIETIAGNGFRGFSGDGGPAREAQLNGPTGIAVDLHQMLWICDSGNNVLRVVSMEIPVRIPGTNEFQANVILTAAGGSAGQSQGKGDGGVAWLARMQGPSGVAVSSAFVSNEDGTLPVNVYISESMGHQVRSMSLEFESYLGVINTLVGSGQRGDNIKEAAPLEAQNAELNEPSGVATDAGVVYLSDSANHRLLMMPALEYVSMGCWRENIESPWIPSIEGQPLPYGIDYLQGIPENRPAAITACALATLRLGYEVFAIRQMGVCATSKDAHLYFRFEGSSTSCDQGKGGARDNSVYRFARQGMMTQQQGLVYVLAGREGNAGFGGDQGSAWITQLSRPNGLGVNPVTKDIYVADSGNNRIRLIFNQMGPAGHHAGKCTNGLSCKVEIMGNGLLPGNKLAVIPMEQSCGQAGVMFQLGLATNPTVEIPSPSFTRKTYDFGPPSVSRTGTYRLCFCVKDAVVFGQITPCGAAEFFIHDAGTVRIVGPDSRVDDAEVVEGMPGRPFALAIFGHELSLFDRVRLVKDSQPCGVPGAEVLADEVQSRSILNGRRYQGNESFSLWVNVTLRASGSFRLCWCQGAQIDGTRLNCTVGEDFRVEAARVNIRGPIQYFGNIRIGSYEEITVKGGQMAGFSSSDRIRLVDAGTVQCGSPEAQAFSNAIEDEQMDAVPYRAPNRITADSVTWTNVKVRASHPLRICWCGDTEGCGRGEDFVYTSAMPLRLLAFAALGAARAQLSELAADDECTNEGCALSALHLRSAKRSEEAVAVDTGCHDVQPGEGGACWEAIMWGKNVGMPQHPDWYPGMTEDSPLSEWQFKSYNTTHPKCPRPCNVPAPGGCTDIPAPTLWKPAAAGGSLQIKVLSYNLFWWHLFKVEGGRGDSAGHLIQNTDTPPYDVMGFQECEDPVKVLGPVGLLEQYEAFQGNHAICVAYRKATWSLLEHGETDVAEDMRTEYYGTRGTQWIRLQHKATNRKLFFVNHHGPLSVNSGGLCGGKETAHKILHVMAKHAQVGDTLVLVGDFNANAASRTLQALWPHLHHVYNSKSFGGVDNIFANLESQEDVVTTTDIGSGGSDHHAISAVINVGPRPRRAEESPESPPEAPVPVKVAASARAASQESPAEATIKAKSADTNCHTAQQGEKCWDEANWAKTQGIFEHPEWYPGLQPDSGLDKFQAAVHKETPNKCPQPCGVPIQESPRKDTQQAQPADTNCHTAQQGEKCWDEVNWAKTQGIFEHPEWYPGLQPDSGLDKFQAAVYKETPDRCPKPCGVAGLDEPAHAGSIQEGSEFSVNVLDHARGSDGCLLEPRTEYTVTGGWYQMRKGVQDPRVCCQLCGQQGQCKAWKWTDWSAEAKDFACFLSQGTVTGKQFNDGAVSGLPKLSAEAEAKRAMQSARALLK